MSENREALRKIYQQEDTSEKTYIPAKPKINPKSKDGYFRVCAYCRVSTDDDEQLMSYEPQKKHYLNIDLFISGIVCQLAGPHHQWPSLRSGSFGGYT